MTGADATASVVVRDQSLAAGTLRWLVLSRPEQRNPLDATTVALLRDLLRSADQDPAVRVVAVTGTGPAFSAGGDMVGYQRLYRDPPAFRAFLADFAEACRLLERGRFASIAAVNGTCVAGGLELVLGCDLVVAAEGAPIGDAHLAFGQLPGAGGSQRLVRAVGPGVARRWFLEAELYTAEQAREDGVVTHVVPDAELGPRVGALAERLAAHSPLAVARLKELVDVAASTCLDVGLERERAVVVEYATTSHDATEGLDAFVARRAPRWEGR